jgi:adenine phosphoribosyltransferase
MDARLPLIERMKDEIQRHIRPVPDYPKPGIIFRDIQPLLRRPDLMHIIAESIAQRWRPSSVGVIVGLDARGFILGGMLMQHLNVPFVMARKKGKLPPPTKSVAYKLEYGTAELEISEGSIEPGESVLIVDDLLATGGTAAAACHLIDALGGKVIGCQFVIEIKGLRGRQTLGSRPINSLLYY